MTQSLPKFMENVTKLMLTTNQQYNWLNTHRCQHRHRFTEHFNCFLTEFEIKERILFIDIETSNLKANFGISLCWCGTNNEGNQYEDCITIDDINKGIEDKRAVETFIETISKHDRICGHYSKRFDIPFMRTRALIHNIKFPERGSLYHTDTYDMAKRNLCLHSNRQDCIAEAILGKTVKTRIDVKAWRQALTGNEKAMREVLDHCRKDVQDLKQNFYKLLPFSGLVKSSI
jgi:uncharacterized protein YprB with RNaseH-like and TPR domain